MNDTRTGTTVMGQRVKSKFYKFFVRHKARRMGAHSKNRTHQQWRANHNTPDFSSSDLLLDAF